MLTRVTVEPPPEHVLSAFGLTGVKPVALGAGWEGPPLTVGLALSLLLAGLAPRVEGTGDLRAAEGAVRE